ncbi:DUF2842 domain-containing protein [Rhizobium sp.]
MPTTLRRIIGTILLVVLVLFYALLAVTIASATLGASPWYIHLAYFFFTGFLWILPAMWLIKWMHKPARK